MIKHYLSPAALVLTAMAFSSCNAQEAGFKKTASGLEYKIVKDVPGIQKPAIGDYMEFHIKSYVRFPKGDSVLFDSRKINNNQPVPFQLTPPQFKGDLVEGFQMLTKGDSAVFRVAVDSVIKAGNQPLPWMTKGKNQKIEYTVSVVTVKTQSQLQAEQKEAASKQIGVDEQLIKDYLAKNNIKAERTASGLYYKIDRAGAGPKVMPGDSVSMNYTGTTLEGTKFDSNVDPQFNHVSPFWFTLGAGQVIRGWDEGIALFSKGGKGTLYIPSPMAYGPQSPSPAIKPNSVLVFDVEVVDSKHRKQ
jgi:FKBP-type peptidyl-prolyl cis-trans isomerase